MPTQGPDHPIRLEAAAARWRARYAGHVIADTADAIIVREADLAPVVYFPRRDVAMEYMARTDHHTRCPYKGEASYYTLRMENGVEENVAWSYEQPSSAAEQLGDRIALDGGRVEVYRVDDARVNPRHRDELARRDIDEIVQHTDAGTGVSQREPWPPNVETPFSGEGGVR